MPKFEVKQSFHITQADLDGYPKRAEAKRKLTPAGQVKPSSKPVWITAGAVYIKGDVIEVTPVEAAELSVVAPEGALEAVNA